MLLVIGACISDGKGMISGWFWVVLRVRLGHNISWGKRQNRQTGKSANKINGQIGKIGKTAK